LKEQDTSIGFEIYSNKVYRFGSRVWECRVVIKSIKHKVERAYLAEHNKKLGFFII